jgi:hypothetical protein
MITKTNGDQSEPVPQFNAGSAFPVNRKSPSYMAGVVAFRSNEIATAQQAAICVGHEALIPLRGLG